MSNAITNTLTSTDMIATNALTLIPMIISIISLLVSLIIAYLVYLRPANPKMLVNTLLSFYPMPGNPNPSAVGFYLPITFYNWSPTGGSILEVRMIVSHTDNPSQNFDMMWLDFNDTIELEDGRPKWELTGKAQPIAIPGRSSISKTIRFGWFFYGNSPMNIREGRYRVIVLAWTHTKKKPNLKEEFFFTITNEQMLVYQQHITNQTPLTIEVFLRENSRSNNIFTDEQVKQLY